MHAIGIVLTIILGLAQIVPASVRICAQDRCPQTWSMIAECPPTAAEQADVLRVIDLLNDGSYTSAGASCCDQVDSCCVHVDQDSDATMPGDVPVQCIASLPLLIEPRAWLAVSEALVLAHGRPFVEPDRPPGLEALATIRLLI